METPTKSLHELMNELTPEYQEEARRFLESLLAKQVRRKRRKPTFDWAGDVTGLRDDRDSVEIQHELLEWRIKRSETPH